MDNNAEFLNIHTARKKSGSEYKLMILKFFFGGNDQIFLVLSLTVILNLNFLFFNRHVFMLISKSFLLISRCLSNVLMLNVF